MPLNPTVAIACRSATVSSTAKAVSSDFSFTAAELAACGYAVVTPRGAGIMLTYGASAAPTSTLGVFVGANTNLTIEGYNNIINLRMIRESSTDATVSVTLEG